MVTTAAVIAVVLGIDACAVAHLSSAIALAICTNFVELTSTAGDVLPPPFVITRLRNGLARAVRRLRARRALDACAFQANRSCRRAARDAFLYGAGAGAITAAAASFSARGEGAPCPA